MTSQVDIRTVLKTKPLAVRRFQLMALEHIEKRAARIKERREAMGLTQEELADRMQDIHGERFPDQPPDKTRGQMVSDWERAVNEPSPPKLELIAAALETTVAALSVDAPNRGETPDPFASSRTRGEESDAVSRIETALREIHGGQAELHAMIARVERLLEDQRKQQQPASQKRKGAAS